jgi:ABC-type dipeptide/oligopeptide/nickel transport system permease component
MAGFVVRRFLGLVLTLWAAATLTFVAVRLVPGDPVAAALSDTNAAPDVIARRRAALGLDQPPPVQYARFLGGLVRGDLGVTWYGGEPVTLAIRQQLPATLALAASAMVVAIVLGFGMGGLSATFRGRLPGMVMSALAGLSLATPVIISGPLLIYLFAIRLDWLPATGQGRLDNLILPAMVLGISASGGIARVVDAGLREALAQPFATTARAKGLTPRKVLNRHALPVALVPVLTVIALQFGFLLGGAVVTESLFARQGIGRLLVGAVLRKDLPLVQGVVLLSAFVYSGLNFLTDLAHAWLDPRVGAELAEA